MADFIIFAIVILNDAAAAATTAAIAPWPRCGVLLVSSSSILATHSSWGVGVGAETSSSSSSSHAVDEWHDLDLGDDDEDDGDERSLFGGGGTNVAENDGDASSSSPPRNSLDRDDSAARAGIDVISSSPPNFVDRFSRAVANEILHRFPFAWDLLRHWQLPATMSNPGGGRERTDHLTTTAGGGVFGGSPSRQKGNLFSRQKQLHVQSERRVGAWCRPTDETSPVGGMEVEAMDKSVVACSPESSPSSSSFEGATSNCLVVQDAGVGGGVDDSSDVRPGMVVYVLPRRFDDAGHGSDDGEKGEEEIDGGRCLLEMGRRYDNDERVVQYTLLQREPVELGNVDVHWKDFAYRPVAGAFELETRSEPGAVDTIAPLAARPRRHTWDDGVGVGDQQVSFRWWSWVSHISQIFHPNAIGSADQGIIYEEDGKLPFAGGSHGEIWRARRRCPSLAGGGDGAAENSTRAFPSCNDGRDLIVKRLKIEHGFFVLEAGLREVYFGELLSREVLSSSLFTTYVDHFFRERVLGVAELWIVFENAGTSLRSFLYTAVDAGGFMLFQHSAFWRRLRRGIAGGGRSERDEAVELFHPNHNQPPDHKHKETQNPERGSTGGRALLREVLKQLVTAVAFLHERGIVHRDIKPSNIMCKTTPATKNGSIPRKIEAIRCLLGDFSSAWDEFSSRNLYVNGPSSKEQTDEYAPPEVLFGSSWIPFSHEHPTSYDSWSIGVVALELLLGTPSVFSVDQRTTALLTNRLQKEGASSLDIQRALYLAALSQFCIFVPTKSEGKSWPLRRGDPLYDVNFVKNKCTMKDFHSALRARDPLGIGFDDDEDSLLHLVWRLLAWNPLERLSASEALDHPYFTAQSHHHPGFLRTKLPAATAIVPGVHNALEHQTLDPKLDMSSDMATITEFVCPGCGKIFADHNSCQRHARTRKHAEFCTYDRSQLPPCLNAHSMLPTHPTSGYCDIQGRRKTIEDFHTVHLGPMHQFYGVFDGHLGNLASKYAASSFYVEIEEYLSNIDDRIRNQTSKLVWQEEVAKQVIQSFEDLHLGIIEAVELSPGGVMDESGTTATILYVSSLAVVIANVGDSRAVMAQWLVDEKGVKYITARQLTIDHIASSDEERQQVLEKGGFVSESGGVDRVMGSLAVSRSLGDIRLASFLSRTPHVLVMTKDEVFKQCGKMRIPEDSPPCFIILASDGLWDVMNNQEAVDLAWQVIKGNKNGTAYQDAAEVLTQEAYVRGSTDNIGVCIVAIT